MITSEQPGFHKLSARERIDIIKEFRGLTDEDACLLYEDFAPKEIFKDHNQWKEYASNKLEEYAQQWGENTIGKFAYFPLRIAPNFLIDRKDYLIPMAIEEPSVAAAASYAASLARKGGGFETEYTGSNMYGQIQVINVTDPQGAIQKLSDAKTRLLELANKQDPTLLNAGGGAKDLDVVDAIKTDNGYMLIAHLLVDVKDVMGANAVNTMVEAISPEIEDITGNAVNLKIISNLAVKRLARSKCKIPIKELARENFSGEEVAERILSAYDFALENKYRATTHNKGIMNGVDAVLLATGQDFRAVEAGAHSYASRSGKYTSLTTCARDADSLLLEIEIPMAVGVYGGIKDSKSQLAKKILGVKTSEEFAGVLASVGLAQNFGAVRALATEGIQEGHMRLHAKQLVEQIDAGEYKGAVLREMLSRKDPITFDNAAKILKELKSK
jgi:hydroxymethylglutaryl-CoA reductase